MGTRARRTAEAVPVQTPGQAYDAYLGLVSAVKSIREIMLSDGDTPTIWTVTMAAPFDTAARKPLYDAQLEVLRACEGLFVSFRIINLPDFPDGGEGWVGPANVTVR